ncbi:alpha-ketoglutarate-dependent dioxygenase AlkB [Marinobacterium zhoushanense]|uniref:Alpha-ketoglutarate-dependent dioxygenase AlkB n=1 Tax=Marinobacterium zhoushanense TaxID=1679163 RepID=A0ABQ1KX48_9GAMM|nr:DNA oxidative demethylase AlkB [Marinobacterium zhoushanense]GGC10653.1 alpha-ketoglutarate-dependent dioxygenase AlkB [Marinobacterium zhoushanense]
MAGKTGDLNLTEALFDDQERIAIADSAWLFRGYARAQASEIVEAVRSVLRQAPLRQMQVPGGHWMSVRTSSCGDKGWVSDSRGYRYACEDPLTGRAWPAIPPLLLELAVSGAARAGFAAFEPDACLINCYQPGAKMGLHQDRDEKDLDAPIVSLSFGLPATFMFGGLTRRGSVKRFPLLHGDMLVWGGPSRMVYHGVAPLQAGEHPMLGAWRVNLTFRRAG